MAVYLLFYFSLVGMGVLFALKIYELKHGVKFFSVARYRADSLLHQKISEVSGYTRYLNRHTAKFVLEAAWEQGVTVYKTVSEKVWDFALSTRWGRIIRGTEIASGNGRSSEYLSRISKDAREEDFR